jgi:hypothetical protein
MLADGFDPVTIYLFIFLAVLGFELRGLMLAA